MNPDQKVPLDELAGPINAEDLGIQSEVQVQTQNIDNSKQQVTTQSQPIFSNDELVIAGVVSTLFVLLSMPQIINYLANYLPFIAVPDTVTFTSVLVRSLMLASVYLIVNKFVLKK